MIFTGRNMEIRTFQSMQTKAVDALRDNVKLNTVVRLRLVEIRLNEFNSKDKLAINSVIW